MKRLWLTAFAGIVCSHNVWAFPSYASGSGFWGAELMTVEERQQYVHRIQAMQSYPECQSYLEAHRKEIQARAQAKQVNLPPPPGQSPCDVMRAMGRFKGNAVYVPSSAPAPK